MNKCICLHVRLVCHKRFHAFDSIQRTCMYSNASNKRTNGLKNTFIESFTGCVFVSQQLPVLTQFQDIEKRPRKIGISFSLSGFHASQDNFIDETTTKCMRTTSLFVFCNVHRKSLIFIVSLFVRRQNVQIQKYTYLHMHTRYFVHLYTTCSIYVSTFAHRSTLNNEF